MQPVDLTSCDREPIHIPGLIQPHGVMLLLRSDEPHDIQVVSDNAATILGVPSGELIGATLDRVLHADDVPDVLTRLFAEPLHLHPIYIHSARGREVPTVFNAVAHRVRDCVILELEPLLDDEGVNASDIYRRLQSAMVDLRLPGPVQALSDKLATHIRGLTGFDRVMIYRFDADWNGEVISEDRRDDLEPFLGLNYPAADIPAQARALYTRNWLRFIADRSYLPARLFPSATFPATGEPLDMSQCVLRSVSPVHLEYLKNMGVDASMSISLIRNEVLWGLVACHHDSPRRVPYDVRAACELIGQVVSLQLADRERAEIAAEVAHKEGVIRRIVDLASPGARFPDSLIDQADDLLDLLNATGVAVVMGDELARSGLTPPPHAIRRIAELVHSGSSEVFVTDKLSDYAPNSGLAATASGVLAIPLARNGPQCIIWFRPEQIRIVNWAGDPAKSVTKGEEPARLSPRGSFALWKQTVQGRSRPWAPHQQAAADELRRRLIGRLLEHASDVLTHNSLLRRVTEEKDQILDSERAARAQAERINRLTDEFVATLSHELRTPLNAIQGWVHLLRTGGSKIDIAKGLDVIDRNTRVQSQMVNDLLDMSRINSGKLRLDVQAVDLATVVESALQTIQFSADAKSIRLHKTIDPMLGVGVSGDPQRLQQIVWNLLSNAVKFTPKGGLVHIELKRSGSYVELNVRDNGIGIPPEFLPHVFDRFRQADASTTRSFGGLGLGLSIVRHLTEMHGGNIGVHSKGPGHGSTFTITFPLRADQLTLGEPHPATAPASGAPVDAVPIAGLEVLVVEDEQDSRDFIRNLLAEHAVNVTAAGSVAEALSIVHERKFDLIISDIGMPGEDGYAFVRQLRALEARRTLPKTPCIALTAYARAEDRRRILLAGFQFHVSKPVEPAELIAVVANLSGRI